MSLNRNDLRTYPVQQKPCLTCPFAGEITEYYLEYLQNLLGRGQQLCHSANNKKICRGGRDIQLLWLYSIGLLPAPTDEEFDQAVNEVMEKI